MSYHPFNLAIRFLLEIICLIAVGLWGYRWAGGSYLAGIGLPAAMMAIWAVFAVPGDKSRSGNAPVPTPGIIRLLLELAFFGLGTWAFLNMGYNLPAWVFGSITVLHYILSINRLKWLMNN